MCGTHVVSMVKTVSRRYAASVRAARPRQKAQMWKSDSKHVSIWWGRDHME